MDGWRGREELMVGDRRLWGVAAAAAGGAGGGYLVEETNWEGAEGGAEDGDKEEGDRRGGKYEVWYEHLFNFTRL